MSTKVFLEQLRVFWNILGTQMEFLVARQNGLGLKMKDLVGGPGGVRTLDLMTASHARSQLRHRPTLCVTE